MRQLFSLSSVYLQDVVRDPTLLILFGGGRGPPSYVLGKRSGPSNGPWSQGGWHMLMPAMEIGGVQIHYTQICKVAMWPIIGTIA